LVDSKAAEASPEKEKEVEILVNNKKRKRVLMQGAEIFNKSVKDSIPFFQGNQVYIDN
jgi:hypothetical protein